MTVRGGRGGTLSDTLDGAEKYKQSAEDGVNGDKYREKERRKRKQTGVYNRRKCRVQTRREPQQGKDAFC